MKKVNFYFTVLLCFFIIIETITGQNPFPATAIQSRTSNSSYATTQNAFYINKCNTGNQDLRGQCTWYVDGRIQELAASNYLDKITVNNVHSKLCSAPKPRHAKYWDTIIGGTWYSTSSGSLPTNLRKPGMIVMWDFGDYGHVAFVEEVNATKTKYRVSEFNWGITLGYTGDVWLNFEGDDRRGTGVYPKFYVINVPSTPTPTILEPISSGVAIPVYFDWSTVSGAEYRIQVSTTSSGWTAQNGFTSSTSASSTVRVNSNTSTSSYFTWSTSASYPPQPNTTYYWTVKAYLPSTGNSSYTIPQKFTTKSAVCNTPSTAQMSATNISATSARLSCSLTSGITQYDWQYKKSTSGSWISLPFTTNNYYNLSNILTKSTKYDFQVMVKCSSGSWSNWSSTKNFTTASSFRDEDDASSSLIDSETPVELFSLFPNPAQNELNVSLDKGLLNQQGTIRIYDINGRLMQKTTFINIQANDFKIDLTNFMNGIYILHLQTEKDTKQLKFEVIR